MQHNGKIFHSSQFNRTCLPIVPIESIEFFNSTTYVAMCQCAERLAADAGHLPSGGDWCEAKRKGGGARRIGRRGRRGVAASPFNAPLGWAPGWAPAQVPARRSGGDGREAA